MTNSTSLFYSGGNTCNSFSLAASTVGGYGLIGGGTISLTIYFGISLANGTTYEYSIALANEQYILGNSVAQ